MVDPESYIDAHRDDLVELALEFLAVNTENPPGDTTELADYIETSLDGLPIDTERVTVDPAKPNLLVTVPGDTDETLLYNGHLDTVPFDVGEWTRDPLGERVDDRIYGRGATDMKGPLAAMLFVIHAFAATDTTPPLTLQFAFVSDEEVGGDAGLPAVLAADRLVATACIIGEPTCEQDRYSVTVADRGSIWLTLDARGEAAHGSRPVLGENAIDRLYRAVEQLRERFGTRQLSLDADVQAIVDESVEYYAPTMGDATARDLFASPSLNLGTIEGGEAINSVPQSARAEVDIRLAAGVDTSEMLSEVRACVADCDGISITDVSWSVGTVETLDSPVVEAVASTAQRVGGKRVYRRSATGGGDAKQLRNAGIPTVEFAFGTDTVHAADEYTTVEALVDNAAAYAALPQTLTQALDLSA